MYYYILGCGIACLILFGIDSMETVCVKPAEMVGKIGRASCRERV